VNAYAAELIKRNSVPYVRPPIDPRYVQVYAVIRVENWESVRPESAESWCGRVKVKEIVATADRARKEVERLNALNAGKGCLYLWQATRMEKDDHRQLGAIANE
jgi:hypothetical protein